MDWIYKGDTITEIPEDAYGFIYILFYEGGYYYIGKKNLFSYTELPVLKNGKERKGHIEFLYRNKKGKRVKYELFRKESKWREYESSSKVVKNYKLISKRIIVFAKSKRELTYLETKYQFLHNVLEDEKALNDNIIGKFFKRNLL